MNLKNLVTVFVAFLLVTQIANAQSGWTLNGSTTASWQNKVVVGDASGQSPVPFSIRTGLGSSQSSNPILRLEQLTSLGSASFWDIENNSGAFTLKKDGSPVFEMKINKGGYYDFNNFTAIRFPMQNEIYMEGNVEIGASASIPASTKFAVQGNSYFSGNVGIGVAAPQDKLDIAGNLRISGNIDGRRSSSSDFRISVNQDEVGGAQMILKPYTMGSGIMFVAGSTIWDDASIRFCNLQYHSYQQNMIIKSNGYVGIGTTTPTSLLTVNGKIECEEIEVKNIAADYVFAADYRLTKLDDLEKYIKQNKHLPGIAPASETENGVNLGEFNEKILEKIEELTLYVIELKKENNELRAKLNEKK